MDKAFEKADCNLAATVCSRLVAGYPDTQVGAVMVSERLNGMALWQSENPLFPALVGLYQQERWLALSESNVQRPPAVYVHDKDWDDDPHQFFVFNNEGTLKQIRWRHFLSDCNSLMADYVEVEKLFVKEIGRANAWLVENHQDIQENFDPKVVKLRKKRKIILTESALDDLRKMEADKD